MGRSNSRHRAEIGAVTMYILAVNAGSSSLKAALYDATQSIELTANFSVENISVDRFEEATNQLASWLSTQGIRLDSISAVGHRVVHGGDAYASATLITNDAIAYLSSIVPLAPNHLPSSLTVIDKLTELLPDTPHVACFDTSFFHDIPEVAQTLALPLSLQRDNHIRRYGFHGLSYSSLLHSFREHEGEVAANGRVIMCHLGSGASIAALKNGKPVDMSMGFTPVSGIVMSTRSGDIEPGVLTFLQKQQDLTSDEIFDLVANKSGLLGVSETTADMQKLLSMQQSDPRAALAVELFCYSSRKAIGSFMAILGGVDSIIFSGGIGERSAEIRARICETLAFMGVEIDEQRNQRSERLISSSTSRVGVHVIPTQEDVSIVRQTAELIDREGNK